MAALGFLLFFLVVIIFGIPLLFLDALLVYGPASVIEFLLNPLTLVSFVVGMIAFIEALVTLYHGFLIVRRKVQERNGTTEPVAQEEDRTEKATVIRRAIIAILLAIFATVGFTISAMMTPLGQFFIEMAQSLLP